MNNISKNIEKVLKYVVMGFATAFGLQYTTGDIPIEYLIFFTGMVSGAINYLKHEHGVKLPLIG